MKLIPDWRKSWKFYSTWVAGAIAFFPEAWARMPQDLKNMVPDGVEPILPFLALAAFLIARNIKQGDDE